MIRKLEMQVRLFLQRQIWRSGPSVREKVSRPHMAALLMRMMSISAGRLIGWNCFRSSCKLWSCWYGIRHSNSIRGPSSHLSLFGLRSTLGLTSRDGVIPLNFDRDIAGPMARTVEDGVRLFDVIADFDPNDPLAEPNRREDLI